MDTCFVHMCAVCVREREGDPYVSVSPGRTARGTAKSVASFEPSTKISS